MEINNKKIILTGAADGIGKELVKKFVSAGSTVYGLDINEEKLNDLKKELNTDLFIPFKIDVSKEENLIKFKKEFMEKYGHVDILINNAGIVQPFVSVDELTNETINRVMNINLFGPINLCRLFIKELKENKTEATIVNVSSMAGFFPFPKQSIYGASKAGLKIFTEGLYAELKNTNVNVMVVLPGAIATNILKNSGTEYKTNKDAGSYKLTSAEEAAKEIINGITKNKFRIFIGSDSKFMNFIYKLNSKKAISFINKKMG